MQVRLTPRSWIEIEAFALGAAMLVACATGLDPVRPGSGGSGSGASASTGALGGQGGGLAGVTSGVTSSSATVGSGGSGVTTTTVASTSGSSTTGVTSSTTATTTTTTTTTSTSSGPPAMGLELQYMCDDTGATVQAMKPWFQIINNGSTAVALSTLTIRYYYTKDGMPATDQTFECDYAVVGCGSLSTTFNTVTGTNADEYVEISFTASAGSLAPGANSGEIQARIHSTDYQYMLTQTNDYSFDATKIAFADWANVTLYQNGTLVWGTEP